MKKLKKPIEAAVIGDPITHSISPKIHNYWLKKYKIAGSYTAIKITKENLSESVKSMIEAGFAGFNVTIPHKETMFRLCDYTSKSAQACKAVNTVIVTVDGKLFGHNSDIEGFLDNLSDSQPNFNLKNKIAFVIGAGGAARAIVYSLIKSGVANICLTNRDQEKALTLIEDFRSLTADKINIDFLNFLDFENQLGKCDLLVNSSSLGMSGQEKLMINLDLLPKSAVVYDIVYKPLMTDLLILASNRGNKIVTGIGMLANQAKIGFEAWFKKEPEIDEELIAEILK